MKNSEYIDYLNSLHNSDGNNENAFAESNHNNPFFEKTQVNRGIGDFIADKLEKEKPQIFVLTGHAGDGKTSLLLQVLKTWNLLDDKELLPYEEIVLPNGRICLYIKDFSEISEEERKIKMKEFIEYPKQGKYVFLVANTGPLIKTLDAVLEEYDKDVQSEFIEMIDGNDGKVRRISGYPFSVINVAKIDNTTFIEPFLKNIISERLWENCENCPKRAYCNILINAKLILKNIDKTLLFLTKHYIWQVEHGNKLTIRQITAHLSYMITGGLSCDSIKRVNNQFKYLFSNLAFGYLGLKEDKNAMQIKAISDLNENQYDFKRTRIDEVLFIKKDYSTLPAEVHDVIEKVGMQVNYNEFWQAAVRRLYFLINIETDEDKNNRLDEDIFSPSFPRFLELRSGANTWPRDRDLIIDALSMIFVGSIKDSKGVPVTLKRETGVTQSVQLIYDTINKKDIRLTTVPSNQNGFGEEEKHSQLRFTVDGTKIEEIITLPLINYFFDIRKGKINTIIDPQLSHGVERLKSQILSEYVNGRKDDTLEYDLLVMKTDDYNEQRVVIENKQWFIG